jgi:hypothetical protein
MISNLWYWGIYATLFFLGGVSTALTGFIAPETKGNHPTTPCIEGVHHLFIKRSSSVNN